jgi:hypothetical protein
MQLKYWFCEISCGLLVLENYERCLGGNKGSINRANIKLFMERRIVGN